MSGAWLALRDYLRADAEAWLDSRIRTDPDPELRARLAANREKVLEAMLDAAELVTLRKAVGTFGKRKRRTKRPAMRLN